MELKIKINNIEEMVDVVKFFSKSTLKFIPTSQDDFVKLLYDTISSGNVSPSWLNNQLFEEYLNIIEQKNTTDIQLNKFIANVKGCYTDSFSTDMLKPTDHFKMLCGPESLNVNGCMTKRMAYNFIMYQISIQNVKTTDDIIYMNVYLNILFNTNLYKIRRDELIDMLDVLFV
jgi:hypothetical protein